MAGKKLVVAALIAVSAVTAFATLGDGRSKGEKPGRSLLTHKNLATTFSLRPGYNFRGSQVINQEGKYINLNTQLTYQKGNTTYVLPLKKKVLMGGKLTFNPNASTR